MDSQYIEYITNIPRHCLRSSMVFSAPHCNYYSRHILVVAEVPHLVNTIPVSFDFLKNYLDNVVIAVRGTGTVRGSEVKDVLPEYIYLKKNDSYNFDVTMTLDTSILSTGEFVCLSFVLLIREFTLTAHAWPNMSAELCMGARIESPSINPTGFSTSRREVFTEYFRSSFTVKK